MATAVTLKESDGSEIYPVTDISLVNNGIHAVDIEATTPVPAVETAMIADGAVTSAKIADGAVTGAKLDTQSYNLASVPTHTFGTYVYSLIRVANIVILNFRLWQSGAITDYAWNNVCTIPSALCPSKDCRGIITVLNGNNGRTISLCRAQLTTAGQISAYPTANGGTSVIGWEGLFVWTI